eukprot:gene7687-8494_t
MSRNAWKSFSEELVFWRAYCEAERSKYTAQHGEKNRFLHFCARVIDSLGWSLSSGPNIPAERERQEEGGREAKFRLHFLQRTAAMVMICLLLNLALLLCLTLGPLVGRQTRSWFVTMASRNSFSWYCATWLVLCVLCLLFYVLLFLDKKHIVLSALTGGHDITQLLQALGRMALMSRVLVLLVEVVAVAAQGPQEGRCIDINLLSPSDHAFFFILGRMVIDIVQMSVVALVPIPRVHVFWLCLIEGGAQTIRLMTCKDHIGASGEVHELLGAISILILPTYCVVIAVPAYAIQQAVQASFEHQLSLREASERTKQLVNLFCSDLKVPVQQTLQLLKDTSREGAEEEEEEEIVRKNDLQVLEGSLTTIASIVDHVVFLMRIQEGRFVYRCSDLVDANSLAEESLRVLQQSLDEDLLLLLHGGSVSQLFELDLPSSHFYSHRHCLLILLLFSLKAAYMRWRYCASSDADRSRLSLTLSFDHEAEEKSSTISSLLVGTICVVDAPRAPDATLVMGASKGRDALFSGRNQNAATEKTFEHESEKEARYHYQTSLMFCSHLLRACHGAFAHHEQDGTIIFSLPIRKAEKEGDHLGGSWHGNDRIDGANTINIISQKLEGMVAQTLCLYSPDPSLMELTAQALRCVIDEEHYDSIPLFEQLNMADMHVRQVVFVTSLSSCMELRRKSYRGLIVLMSDRLAYLDDRDKIFYSYALSISPSPQQLQELVVWLNVTVQEMRQEEEEQQEDMTKSMYSSFRNGPRSDERKTSRDGTRRERDEEVMDVKVSLPTTSKGRTLKGNSSECTPCCWLPCIPQSSGLNYWSWRMLNPSGDVFHHTNLIDFYVCVAIFVEFAVYAVYGFDNLTSFVTVLPSLIFFAMRRLVVEDITSHSKVFYYAVLVTNCIVCIAPFAYSLTFYTLITHHHPFKAAPLPSGVHNMRDFVLATYGSQNAATGGRVLINFLWSFMFAKGHSEFLLWPFSLVGAFSQVVSPIILIAAIFSTFMGRDMFVFVLVFTLLGHVYIIALLVCTENLRRQEFLGLRQVFLSRDFLERCVFACWRNTFYPLASLTQIQERMLQEMTVRALVKEEEQQAVAVQETVVVLEDEVVQRMEELVLSVTLSKELLYEMQMSLRSLAATGPPREGQYLLVQKMEIILLRPLVERVISLFIKEDLVDEEGLPDDSKTAIRFHMQLHPSLLLIRCERNLLEAMLCNVCRAAVDRVKDSVRKGKQRYLQQLSLSHGMRTSEGEEGGQLGWHRELVHDILIRLDPEPNQSSVKFSDIHMMQLFVYDTALALPSSSSSSSPVVVAHSHPGSVKEDSNLSQSQPQPQPSFMKDIYESFMKLHGVSQACYRLERLDRRDCLYRHCQRVALPYKLCPSTPKVAAFYPNLASQHPVVVQPSHSFYYNRYLKEKQQMEGFMRWRRPSGPSSSSTAARRPTKPRQRLTMLTYEDFKNDQAKQRKRRLFRELNDACSSSGWNCEFLYLELGAMPSQAALRRSSCIMVDEDLSTVNGFADRPKQYLQELILYLRCHDFWGIVAFVGDRPLSTNTEATAAEHDPLKLDNVRVQVACEIAGFSANAGVMSPDICFVHPVGEAELRDLATLSRMRLLRLALPSVSGAPITSLAMAKLVMGSAPSSAGTSRQGSRTGLTS